MHEAADLLGLNFDFFLVFAVGVGAHHLIKLSIVSAVVCGWLRGISSYTIVTLFGRLL